MEVGGVRQERREGGMEFFVSLLQALNNLPSFWEILVTQSMFWALAWKFARASWPTLFSHPHSLFDHDTFSVNWKTNIQETRMPFLGHFKQLLMATCAAKDAVTKTHTKYLHHRRSGINLQGFTVVLNTEHRS